MTSNNMIDLNGVWGSSPTDVFAVGDSYYYTSGIILHYNGSTWSQMTIPVGEYSLYAVWGSSAKDVFAIGMYSNGPEGIILHYDGSTWSKMVGVTADRLYGVWGSSANDVYAVGDYSGAILHYNGSTWSTMKSGSTNMLHGVWGLSATDIFAVGSLGAILHYGESNFSTICPLTTTVPPTSTISTTTTVPLTVIELVSFTAQPSNKKVQLEWKTESEIDNAGFNLYRSESEDGEYIKINSSLIAAEGSSTQGVSYEFIDTKVKNRKTYYYCTL